MTAGDVLLTPPPDVQGALDAAEVARNVAADADVAWRRAVRDRDVAAATAQAAQHAAVQAALIAELRALGWGACRQIAPPPQVAAHVSSSGLTVRVQLAQGRPDYVADWRGSRAYGLGIGPTLRHALAALAADLRHRYRGRAPLDMAARLESAIGGAP